MDHGNIPKQYKPYWTEDFIEPSFLRKAISVFFPERCYSCGEVVSCGTLFCDSCLPKIHPVVPPICLGCAQQQAFCDCDKNQNQNQNISGFLAPFYYVGAIREAVHRFKFNNCTYIKDFFYKAMVKMLIDQLPFTEFDFVTPVPISKKSYQVRGYNQSELLAREISKVLKIPCIEILDKFKENLPQRELTAKKRLENVKGVYAVKDSVDISKLKNKTVLIVDDVITTGATLNECARTMSELGTYRIYAISAATTLIEKNN